MMGLPVFPVSVHSSLEIRQTSMISFSAPVHDHWQFHGRNYVRVAFLHA